MKRTDRNKCRHTKQEIVKPQRTGDNFACQTLAFLPTLGLTIALIGILTIKTYGQVPTVQTPTFLNFQQVPQPWIPIDAWLMASGYIHLEGQRIDEKGKVVLPESKGAHLPIKKQ